MTPRLTISTPTVLKNPTCSICADDCLVHPYLGGNRTSNQLEYRNLKDASGEVRLGFKYVYDVLGNIIEIRKSTGEHDLLYAYTYDYDADGIRTEKVVDGVDHTYLTLNGKVVRESFPYGSSTVVMHFIYDESGRPFGLLYSTNGGASFDQYYYAVNTQGDVEGIFLTKKDSNGVQRISWRGRYTYDAWGNVLSVTNVSGDAVTSPNHFMNRNPLCYRGYYYDVETGFYYLQSRYYDPANHRFINADCYTSTGRGFLGYNMFAYCRNNPVTRKDASGTDDVVAQDFNEDNNPLNDSGQPSGSGSGGSCGVGTGPTNSGSDVDIIGKQLEECARKANAAVPEKGPVGGTHKHSFFKDLVEKL